MNRNVILLGLFSGAVFAQARLSPDLQEFLAAPSAELRSRKQADEPIDVIVQYKDSDGTGVAAKRALGRVKHAFRSLPARVESIAPSRLAELLDDPDVEYVTPDREVSGAGSEKLGVDMVRPVVGLPANYTSVNGAGVGVAVIDSGIITGDRYFGKVDGCSTSRIVYNQNFVAGETSAADTYGHGTHVSGIVGGNGKCMSLLLITAQPFSGIAPGANLVNLRVLDGKGRGSDSAVIAAIDRAIQLKSTYNIRVMNLSLGRMIYESFEKDPLCQAVARAWKAGIVVVVAAGNNGRDNSMNTQGYGTISSPGNSPWVVTVGSARFDTSLLAPRRSDATAASYSSKGPTLLNQIVKPDLVAPGNRIVSRIGNNAALKTFLDNFVTYAVNGLFIDSLTLSGTSMAAPVVSGAAALMIQKDSTLTPDQVKARLMKTAWKGFPATAKVVDWQSNSSFNIQHDVFTIGSGMLDVDAALKSTDKIPANASALSPRVARVNGKVVLAEGYPEIGVNSIVWGDSVVWGESVVWGSSNVLSNNVVWGDSVVWGSANMAGNSIVWGDSVVWGDATPFSESLSLTGDK